MWKYKYAHTNHIVHTFGLDTLETATIGSTNPGCNTSTVYYPARAVYVLKDASVVPVNYYGISPRGNRVVVVNGDMSASGPQWDDVVASIGDLVNRSRRDQSGQNGELRILLGTYVEHIHAVRTAPILDVLQNEEEQEVQFRPGVPMRIHVPAHVNEQAAHADAVLVEAYQKSVSDAARRRVSRSTQRLSAPSNNPTAWVDPGLDPHTMRPLIVGIQNNRMPNNQASVSGSSTDLSYTYSSDVDTEVDTDGDSDGDSGGDSDGDVASEAISPEEVHTARTPYPLTRTNSPPVPLVPFAFGQRPLAYLPASFTSLVCSLCCNGEVDGATFSVPFPCSFPSHRMCDVCVKRYVLNYHNHPCGLGRPHIVCPHEGCDTIYPLDTLKEVMSDVEYTALCAFVAQFKEVRLSATCPHCHHARDDILPGEFPGGDVEMSVGHCICECPRCTMHFCYHCEDDVGLTDAIGRPGMICNMCTDIHSTPPHPGHVNRCIAAPCNSTKRFVRNRELTPTYVAEQIVHIAKATIVSIQCRGCGAECCKGDACNELTHCGIRVCWHCGQSGLHREPHMIDHFSTIGFTGCPLYNEDSPYWQSIGVRAPNGTAEREREQDCVRRNARICGILRSVPQDIATGALQKAEELAQGQGNAASAIAFAKYTYLS
jgi:hypothetical protein